MATTLHRFTKKHIGHCFISFFIFSLVVGFSGFSSSFSFFFLSVVLFCVPKKTALKIILFFTLRAFIYPSIPMTVRSKLYRVLFIFIAVVGLHHTKWNVSFKILKNQKQEKNLQKTTTKKQVKRRKCISQVFTFFFYSG